MPIEHGLERLVEQLADLAAPFPTPGDRRREETLRSVVKQIKEFSLDGPSMNRRIFTPLAEGLVERWGIETGPHLYHQIVTAFRDEGLSVARGQH